MATWDEQWTWKDVQEMWRDVKNGKYPRVAKYKVFTFVDGREVEVVRVRKVTSTEYLKVTVPPHVKRKIAIKYYFLLLFSGILQLT